MDKLKKPPIWLQCRKCTRCYEDRDAFRQHIYKFHRPKPVPPEAQNNVFVEGGEVGGPQVANKSLENPQTKAHDSNLIDLTKGSDSEDASSNSELEKENEPAHVKETLQVAKEPEANAGCSKTNMTHSERTLRGKETAMAKLALGVVKKGGHSGLAQNMKKKKKRKMARKIRYTNKVYRCEICKKPLETSHGLKYHMALHNRSPEAEKSPTGSPEIEKNEEGAKKKSGQGNEPKLGGKEVKGKAKKKTRDEPESSGTSEEKPETINAEVARPKSGLVCNFCLCSFQTRKALIKHQANVEAGELRCAECPETFRIKKCLLWHERKAHSDADDKRFHCSICPKIFITIRQRQYHERVHSNDPNVRTPYPCLSCNDKFRRIEDVITHFDSCSKLKRNPPSPHVPQLIPERSRDRSDRNLNAPQIYKCLYCEKTFATKLGLSLHQKNKHPSKLTIKFSERYSIIGTEEARVRHSYGPYHIYKCRSCEKRFTSKNYLTKHRNTHTKELCYKCRFCSKIYYDYYLWYSHIRVTHKQPKFGRRGNHKVD